jgi:uncharacterized protein (DUF697 family)/GTP-binding protein EngB required for normal cell division
MSQKIRLTLLICGQTGTGKSSIANFRLKQQVAKVGNSAESIRNGFPPPRYENDDIVFYDSDGYETGKTEEYKENIYRFLSGKKDVDGVHLVWYTINSAGHRFTNFDIDFVNKIQAQGFPVGILLTKIDECDETGLSDFVSKVRQSFAGKEIFRVSTMNNTYIQSNFCDWDKLIDWTMRQWQSVIKERGQIKEREQIKKMRNEQLKEMQKQANIAIGIATTASAGVGMSPIPFSDAALLIPVQVSMIARITSVYKLPLAGSVVSSVIGPIIASALGRSLAGNLIKFIPGVGSIAGGAINAGTAGIITAAIGKAVIEICHKYIEKGDNSDFGEIFTKGMSNIRLTSKKH